MKLENYLFKVLKKVYSKIVKTKYVKNLNCIQDVDKVSEIIYEALLADKPCMIARFGANELNCLCNYVGVKLEKKQYYNYIKGKTNPWWWDQSTKTQMQNFAGFFPTEDNNMEQFSELMLRDMQEVDILGSWQLSESNFEEHLVNAKKVRLMYLDPFWTKTPWTKALKGKKILVVHPFVDTIKKQYTKRELLFNSKDILPEFQSLSLIKAVQSLDNSNHKFTDWFEALDYMKSEIEKCDFDICLIGCGAYGFPLAAHVKRMGKKAVHIGGSLQLLFGIKGKRWEVNDPHYEPGNVFIDYYSLPNEFWVRPSEEEKPGNHQKVEDSCYW